MRSPRLTEISVTSKKKSSRKNIPLDTPKIDEKHLRGYLERYRDYKLPFYPKSYLDIA